MLLFPRRQQRLLTVHLPAVLRQREARSEANKNLAETFGRSKVWLHAVGIADFHWADSDSDGRSVFCDEYLLPTAD